MPSRLRQRISTASGTRSAFPQSEFSPAIYLEMEAERLFGAGEHSALDDLTVSLSQPDGAISLLSGGTTVNGYLFSPPFIQQMTDKPGIRKSGPRTSCSAAPQPL